MPENTKTQNHTGSHIGLFTRLVNVVRHQPESQEVQTPPKEIGNVICLAELHEKASALDWSVTAIKFTLNGREREMKRHKNKNRDVGGFVETTATAGENTYIGKNALILDRARVTDSARVFGTAWVASDAQVTDNAHVYGDALVADSAIVSGPAWVSGNTLIYGKAQISGNVLVISGKISVDFNFTTQRQIGEYFKGIEDLKKASQNSADVEH